mmetsp:Transcript_9212/g.31716  ORF Transcript_9212/g.31716 Transcript_9212/m.31716 type:complete len:369 (-) Transcript_9212:467-1573(-)
MVVVKEEEAFDEAAFVRLRAHYYDPVVEFNVVDPRTSRSGHQRVQPRKESPPRIDSNSPGFTALKREIAALEGRGERPRVLEMLRKLRAWEVRPPSLGGASLSPSKAASYGRGGASSEAAFQTCPSPRSSPRERRGSAFGALAFGALADVPPSADRRESASSAPRRRAGRALDAVAACDAVDAACAAFWATLLRGSGCKSSASIARTASVNSSTRICCAFAWSRRRWSVAVRFVFDASALKRIAVTVARIASSSSSNGIVSSSPGARPRDFSDIRRSRRTAPRRDSLAFSTASASAWSRCSETAVLAWSSSMERSNCLCETPSLKRSASLFAVSSWSSAILAAVVSAASAVAGRGGPCDRAACDRGPS